MRTNVHTIVTLLALCAMGCGDPLTDGAYMGESLVDLEGSILLWAFVLCGYVVAVVVKFRNDGDDPMMAWVMLTLLIAKANGTVNPT